MGRATQTGVTISVVLPVFNEEGVLVELLRRVTEAVESTGSRPQIIFVNDGSRDGSARLLDDLATVHPYVQVLHLSRNFGHQAAVQAGLAHATGNVVLLMDSDMQDAPRRCPAFFCNGRPATTSSTPYARTGRNGFRSVGCSRCFIARWPRLPTRQFRSTRAILA